MNSNDKSKRCSDGALIYSFLNPLYQLPIFAKRFTLNVQRNNFQNDLSKYFDVMILLRMRIKDLIEFSVDLKVIVMRDVLI